MANQFIFKTLHITSTHPQKALKERLSLKVTWNICNM